MSDFLKIKGKNVINILLIDPFPNIDAAQELWPDTIIDTIDRIEEFDLYNYLKTALIGKSKFNYCIVFFRVERSSY